jgi:hypothetical protein
MTRASALAMPVCTARTIAAVKSAAGSKTSTSSVMV